MDPVIRTGASGFSYREWLGRFYPDKLPLSKMLPYYAERLTTVEINYTFRAMPKRTMLEGWAAKVPAHFRFGLKAPQRITHFARLRASADTLDYFLETANSLGQLLGPVLFQLPPDLPRDHALLSDFLAKLDRRVCAAFEFRNPSWFDDKVFDLLRQTETALCVAETEKMLTPLLCTAPIAYLRLRKEFYTDDALRGWADSIRRFAAGAREVYVYFKHEAAAPELATKLHALLTPA
jgi:uncharacterized protein YecE (DUF72 family)